MHSPGLLLLKKEEIWYNALMSETPDRRTEAPATNGWDGKLDAYLQLDGVIDRAEAADFLREVDGVRSASTQERSELMAGILAPLNASSPDDTRLDIREVEAISRGEREPFRIGEGQFDVIRTLGSGAYRHLNSVLAAAEADIEEIEQRFGDMTPRQRNDYRRMLRRELQETLESTARRVRTASYYNTGYPGYGGGYTPRRTLDFRQALADTRADFFRENLSNFSEGDRDSIRSPGGPISRTFDYIGRGIDNAWDWLFGRRVSGRIREPLVRQQRYSHPPSRYWPPRTRDDMSPTPPSVDLSHRASPPRTERSTDVATREEPYTPPERYTPAYRPRQDDFWRRIFSTQPRPAYYAPRYNRGPYTRTGRSDWSIRISI